MPKEWHDRHAVGKIDDPDKKELYRKIAADKKPYFMRYIYPALMKQYNSYVKKANRNSLREFQLSVEDLMNMPVGKTTEEQREFIGYHNSRMPVGMNDCVMNKICRKFEQEFDGCVRRNSILEEFDRSLLKSDAEYSTHLYYEIMKLYDEYNKRLQNFEVFVSYERIDKGTAASMRLLMNKTFREACDKICPNQDVLCNILVDMCYSKNKTKWFAWGVCGEEMIGNLLKKNNNVIHFPTLSEDGEVTYCGNRFTVKSKTIESEDVEWV